MTNDKTPLKEHSKITLKQFIDDNHKLLTVMGVFAALTAFFSSKREFIIYLSLFSFIMFLLLCWELWINFPKSEESSTNIKVFEYFFMLLLLSVAGQILISYKDILLMYSNLLMTVGMFYIYGVIVTKIINKYELYLYIRNLAEKDKRLAPLIRSLGFVITLEIIFLLTLFTWVAFLREPYLYITQNYVNKSILFA